VTREFRAVGCHDIDHYRSRCFAVSGPALQPGTRSQQPFQIFPHHIPASAVVLKLNYVAEPTAMFFVITFKLQEWAKINLHS